MAEDSAKGQNFKSYNLEKAQKKKTDRKLEKATQLGKAE